MANSATAPLVPEDLLPDSIVSGKSVRVLRGSAPDVRQSGRQNDRQMTTLELPKSIAPALDAIVAVDEPYEGVYLVGGTVRDILLGERNFDVDVVVEGDAIALARAVADKLDGRFRAHRKFGTAVVLYGENERLDLVTARSETYHAPAVLPTVAPGTIQEDLHRRDFTINAMAVSLKGENLGELVDPFEGRTDLEAGRIRVLHDRSFIDDPTRILRAIRYEDRYGFRMDEHTVELARQCIATGHVGDLSGARLRDELIALLSEGDVSHAIPRLAELGAEKEVHPHVVADVEAVGLFDRLRELNERYQLGVPAWRLGLEALARKLPPTEIAGWLFGLKVRNQDGHQITAAITQGPKIAEGVSNDSLAPADVVTLAEPGDPDAPLFALALTDSPRLHEYFERLRGIRLEISGADIAEMGLAESPRVGEILGELRRRKLNGELDGRDSELAAARELVGQP
jgi:tRNA nucleotidyltransferase (CCA-adding enzyme)